MTTTYPGATDSFTTKVDGVDDVLASHVNNLQDSVVAIETLVGYPLWTSWTPVVTQGSALALGILSAKYILAFKWCHIFAEVIADASGTSGEPIYISGIPSAAQPYGLTGSNLSTIGTGSVYDVGAALYYGLTASFTASQFCIIDSYTRGVMGQNPAFGLVSGDYVLFRASYLVA